MRPLLLLFLGWLCVPHCNALARLLPLLAPQHSAKRCPRSKKKNPEYEKEIACVERSGGISSVRRAA